MDFPCSECQYDAVCYPFLRRLQPVKNFCQQGRRKKSQTKITDVPDKTVT